MARLTHEYNIGWYGECSDGPCADVLITSLQNFENISEIYEVYSANPNEVGGTGYAAWTITGVMNGIDYNFTFTSLECGKSYVIRMKTGKDIDIPGFTPTDLDNPSALRLSDFCATYHDATPTPTPTPTTTPPNVTPTVTPTLTPIGDGDDTEPYPSVTPSLTVTPTVTPTISLTPTPTPSEQIVPTPTVTPTVTPSTAAQEHCRVYYRCDIDKFDRLADQLRDLKDLIVNPASADDDDCECAPHTMPAHPEKLSIPWSDTYPEVIKYNGKCYEATDECECVDACTLTVWPDTYDTCAECTGEVPVQPTPAVTPTPTTTPGGGYIYNQCCEPGEVYEMCPPGPAPTPVVTPSVTVTPSVAVTPSVTVTPTIDVTPTIPVTPSVTPTIAVTPTPTTCMIDEDCDDVVFHLQELYDTTSITDKSGHFAQLDVQGAAYSRQYYSPLTYPINSGCIAFDGVDDYIELSNSTNEFTWLSAPNANYTIEGWLHRHGSNDEGVIFGSRTSASGGHGVELLVDQSYLYWTIDPATGTTCVNQTNLQTPLDRWFHFAVVVHNGDTCIYIDGVKSNTYGATHQNNEFTSYPQNFQIGATLDPARDRFLNGSLQDFRISKKSLYLCDFTPLQSAHPDCSAEDGAATLGGILVSDVSPPSRYLKIGIEVEDIAKLAIGQQVEISVPGSTFISYINTINTVTTHAGAAMDTNVIEIEITDDLTHALLAGIQISINLNTYYTPEPSPSITPSITPTVSSTPPAASVTPTPTLTPTVTPTPTPLPQAVQWFVEYEADTNFTDTQKGIIQDALNAWSSVIRDPRTIEVNVGYASAAHSSSGGLLAYATPTRIDTTTGTYLPTAMNIRFDLMDLSNSTDPNANTNPIDTRMITTSSGDVSMMYYVASHEIAHGLGIGSFWNEEFTNISTEVNASRRLVYNGNTMQPLNAISTYSTESEFVAENPIYIGVHGLAAYKQVLLDSGWNADQVAAIPGMPVEDNADSGTRGVHPEETYYGRWVVAGDPLPGLQSELTTGYIQSSSVNPFSKITMGMLKDIGWIVDSTQFEPFTVPYCVPITHSSLDYALGYETVTGPWFEDVNCAQLHAPYGSTIIEQPFYTHGAGHIQSGTMYKPDIPNFNGMDVPVLDSITYLKITHDGSSVTIHTTDEYGTPLDTITTSNPLTVLPHGKLRITFDGWGHTGATSYSDTAAVVSPITLIRKAYTHPDTNTGSQAAQQWYPYMDDGTGVIIDQISHTTFIDEHTIEIPTGNIDNRDLEIRDVHGNVLTEIIVTSYGIY